MSHIELALGLDSRLLLCQLMVATKLRQTGLQPATDGRFCSTNKLGDTVKVELQTAFLRYKRLQGENSKLK